MIGSDLDLSTALVHLYYPSNPGIAKQTVKLARFRVAAWLRILPESRIVRLVTTADFNSYRRLSLERGSSPATIESVIETVRLVLRSCVEGNMLDVVPPTGRRLRVVPKLRTTPTIADLDAVLRHCHAATWPPRRYADPSAWWRMLIATGFFTALRRNDALRLPVENIRSGTVALVMEKTGRVIRIPVHPVLKKLADSASFASLGKLNSVYHMRCQMAALCLAAGVPYFTMQGIRRLSAQSWESARAGAGGLILGHAFPGNSKFYLDPLRSLQDALVRLEFPVAFGRRSHRDEPRLIAAYRRLDPKEAQTLVRFAERLSE